MKFFIRLSPVKLDTAISLICFTAKIKILTVKNSKKMIEQNSNQKRSRHL